MKYKKLLKSCNILKKVRILYDLNSIFTKMLNIYILKEYQSKIIGCLILYISSIIFACVSLINLGDARGLKNKSEITQTIATPQIQLWC